MDVKLLGIMKKEDVQKAQAEYEEQYFFEFVFH